jgi:type VI protein secretion system component Hcp
MAATDIPPTPLLLRIPGLKGDQALSGFNVQSFDWTLLNEGSGQNKQDVTLTRLVDGASPTISGAFALRKNVGTDATLTVVDATGAEVVSYVFTEPRVVHYELGAAVGGNERATETILVRASHVTITIAKTKRSWTL